MHGVTAHTRGVRCSLFLCTLPEPPSLEYLIAPALEQLRFFERALRYIDTASDESLSGCVREYESFLLSGEGDVPSLEVEVVWRAHLLMPAAYAEDCARLEGQQRLIEHSPEPVASYRSGSGSSLSAGSGSVLQTDLVSAVRRQRGFMRQMLELERAGAVTAEHLAAELEPYRAFLQQAGSADKELPVPGLLLDLVWHTHMLHPQRYASECRRIAGRLVDHDDA